MGHTLEFCLHLIYCITAVLTPIYGVSLLYDVVVKTGHAFGTDQNTATYPSPNGYLIELRTPAFISDFSVIKVRLSFSKNRAGWSFVISARQPLLHVYYV